MTTKSPLQKILQGILHTEHESKQNHEGVGSIKMPSEKNHKKYKNINLDSRNQDILL
jgi:hypothetical protein